MGRPFLYRCPITGLSVQGLTSNDEPSTNGDIRYETVMCLACGQLHLVDPFKGPLPPPDKE